jgi:phage repressor protein C with HTH and peptisase S24 domain
MKTNTLNTLSDRLLYALEMTGTKKSDLARAINVQPQTIQHLCYGEVQSSRFTFELATVLGLNTRWLATGEGEMFLADDPKHKLFKEYKKIPLLNTEQLIALAKSGDLPSTDDTNWTVLKTQDTNIFCTRMSDASMLPLFQPNAQIFFKKINKASQKEIKQSDVVIVYFQAYDSLMIRQVSIEKNHIFLSPLNKNLFKDFELTDEVIIFGEAMECHFTINQK